MQRGASKRDTIGFSVLILLLGTVAAFASTHVIHVKHVDQQIQIGTAPDAPAYYVQYRTPSTDWQTWTSKSTVPEGINGVWFRAIFETNPEEPMEWELEEDVDQVLASESASATTNETTYWHIIGEFGEDGSFTAAYDKNPDPMMALASDTPPTSYAEPTQNNQAVATPDPGTGRLYWFSDALSKSVVWHLSDNGIYKAGLPLRDDPIVAPWYIAGAADINTDGTDDIILHNPLLGRVIVWFLDPDGMLASSQRVRDPDIHPSWDLKAVTDVNGDGIADIVWHQQEWGRTVVWFLNAEGIYQSGQRVRDPDIHPSWDLKAVTDVNGDGAADIVWHQQEWGRTVVWFLNAEGIYQSGQRVRDPDIHPSWMLKAVTDVNGDDAADIVWFQPQMGRTVVWFLNAEGIYQSGQRVRDPDIHPDWNLKAVTDIDGDGVADIVWHLPEWGRTVVWFLNSEGIYQSGQRVRDPDIHPDWNLIAVSE